MNQTNWITFFSALFRGIYDNVLQYGAPSQTRTGARDGIRTRSVSNVADFKSAAFLQFRHSRFYSFSNL